MHPTVVNQELHRSRRPQGRAIYVSGEAWFEGLGENQWTTLLRNHNGKGLYGYATDLERSFPGRFPENLIEYNGWKWAGCICMQRQRERFGDRSQHRSRQPGIRDHPRIDVIIILLTAHALFKSSRQQGLCDRYGYLLRSVLIPGWRWRLLATRFIRGWSGFTCHSSGGHGQTVHTVIMGNDVHDNSQHGISCFSDIGDLRLNPEIIGNRIYQNGSDGIHCTRRKYMASSHN